MVKKGGFWTAFLFLCNFKLGIRFAYICNTSNKTKMTLRFILFIGFVAFSIGLLGQVENNAWKSFPTNDTIKTIGAEGILSDTLPHMENLGSLPVCIKPGTSTFSASPEIIEWNEKYTEKSKNNTKIKGYTILLFSGSGANSKLKARNTLVHFDEKYPGCQSHLAWKSPNYEVRIGDFRTKLEAEKLLQEIKEEFPTAFVKADFIELPLLDPVVIEEL